MPIDYKETLFLPNTSFPMRANLAKREHEFLKFWDEINLYDELKKRTRGNTPLFFMMGHHMLMQVSILEQQQIRF